MRNSAWGIDRPFAGIGSLDASRRRSGYPNSGPTLLARERLRKALRLGKKEDPELSGIVPLINALEPECPRCRRVTSRR